MPSKSVVDGVVLRTSPSAIEKSDPNTPYGCERAWWYTYVAGIRDPAGPAAALGTKIHKQIEKYLQSGHKALGAIAMAAMHFIPDPHPDLEIEYTVTPQDHFDVGGLPVRMQLDVINPLDHYINPMGVIVPQPSDEVEVLDWKTKGDISRGFTGRQLLTTHQMVIYGKFVAQRYGVDRVRLSHVYMQTKGAKKASKSTVLATLEDLEPQWQKTQAQARRLVELGKEKDISRIPGDLRKCPGCFYNDRCPKTAHQTLTQIMGKTQAMSLLPTNQDPAVQLAITQLQQQEAAGTVHQLPPSFAAALMFIQVQGYGRPALSGDAAKYYAQSNGWQLDPTGKYAGEGKTESVEIADPALVEQLANEVSAATGKAFEVPAAILPPDAPPSQPHLAADPVEGFAAPPPPPVVEAPITTEAPKAAVEAEDLTQSEALTQAIKASTTGKKWPKMPQLREAFTELLNQKVLDGPKTQAPSPVSQPAGATVQIFVDCIVPDATDLAPVIDKAVETLALEFGARDIRCAPQDGPLGYGAWKGALAAYVREAIVLEPGTYFLDTRGSEIKSIAVEAFGQLVVARGIR